MKKFKILLLAMSLYSINACAGQDEFSEYKAEAMTSKMVCPSMAKNKEFAEVHVIGGKLYYDNNLIVDSIKKKGQDIWLMKTPYAKIFVDFDKKLLTSKFRNTRIQCF